MALGNPTEAPAAREELACLSENDVLDLVEHRISAEQQQLVESHLDACAACRRLVSDLAVASLDRSETSRAPGSHEVRALGTRPTARSPEDVTPRPGSTIDRYVLLEPLGAGGMGLVFAAYDPRLKRKVALKLVRVVESDAAASSMHSERLVREAQVMARLSHPNVTSVFDVGIDGSDVFIAMELVDGTTLTEWLATRRCHWREILDAFIAAGHGLAAAHAANVVHRDFKPDNVLVGRDGRVSVSDFGLARTDGVEMSAASDGVPKRMPDGDREPTAARMTAAGTRLGTPAYMAPEQGDNAQAADARSDQYSFCASLCEALWGTRPGMTPLPGSRPAARGRVPRRLRQIVNRGLSSDPLPRFPSMRELLAALARVQRRRRHAVLLAVASAGVLAAAIVISSRSGRTEPHASACGGASEQLRGVWDADRKQQLGAALLDHHAPYAPTIANAIENALDRYANRWVAMHTEACEATAVRHDQPESVLALRMTCLEQHRQELEQAIGVLADPQTPIDHGLEVATALSPIARCADLPALEQLLPEPSGALSDRIAAVRKRLLHASAQCQAGLYAACEHAAKALVDEARAIGYPLLVARVFYVIADAEGEVGDVLHAEAALEDAVVAAEASRDDALVVEADTLEAELVGTTKGRYDEGLRLLRHAEASAARLATVSPRSAFDAEGVVLDGRTFLALEHHDPEAAAQLGIDALKHSEQTYGRDAHETARAHLNVAAALDELGRLDEAMAHDEKAREILTALEGPAHPELLTLEPNIAVLLSELGRVDEAATRLERLLPQAEATYGKSDPQLLKILDALANNRIRQHRGAEALTLVDRALAIREAYPSISAAERLGELGTRGTALGQLGRAREADAAYRLAIEETEHLLGPTSQALVPPLQRRAMAALDAGHAQAAISMFERALTIADRSDGSPLSAARVRMGLATALASIRERDRAIALARAARAQIEHVHGGEGLMPPIDAFLAKQTARR